MTAKTLFFSAMILLGLGIIGKQYFSKVTTDANFHTCIDLDGSTFETTEPCKENFSEINPHAALDYDKPENVELFTYKGEYFSTKYPKNWHEWYGGGGYELEVLQVNDVSEEDNELANASIVVHVTDNQNPESQANTASEYIELNKKNTKNINTFSLNGNEGVIEYRYDECCITVLVVIFKNDVRYNIGLTIYGATEKERDENYKKYRHVLDILLDNFEY